MSHRIYHTQGLILARHNYGEANAVYQIFTADLGLLGVSAQGVRYLKSKLRSQLSLLTHGQISLVRGRETWRLIGAEASGKLDELFLETAKLKVWARVANLLKRLLPGEESQPELFADLLAGLETLKVATPDLINNCELALVVRLLNALGYVENSNVLNKWLASDLWFKQDLLALPVNEADQLVAVINRGLTHSQL